jgi:hypothetical protein
MWEKAGRCCHYLFAQRRFSRLETECAGFAREHRTDGPLSSAGSGGEKRSNDGEVASCHTRICAQEKARLAEKGYRGETGGIAGNRRQHKNGGARSGLARTWQKALVVTQGGTSFPRGTRGAWSFGLDDCRNLFHEPAVKVNFATQPHALQAAQAAETRRVIFNINSRTPDAGRGNHIRKSRGSLGHSGFLFFSHVVYLAIQTGS